MGRRLKGTVPIHNEDGSTSWYGPDDKVPADVAKEIGDHAWTDDDGDDDGEAGAGAPARRRAR